MEDDHLFTTMSRGDLVGKISMRQSLLLLAGMAECAQQAKKTRVGSYDGSDHKQGRLLTINPSVVWLSSLQYRVLVAQMRRKHRLILLNYKVWGLANENLPETVIAGGMSK